MKRSLMFLTCCAVLYGVAMLTAAAAAVTNEGETVFAAKCKNCHGADGSGNPAIAKVMNVTMKPLGSESDANVKAAVNAGVGKMKPVAGVAAGDLDNVIAYIHTLKK